MVIQAPEAEFRPFVSQEGFHVNKKETVHN